jgi:hypothetical protein
MPVLEFLGGSSVWSTLCRFRGIPLSNFFSNVADDVRVGQAAYARALLQQQRPTSGRIAVELQ